MAYKLKLTNKFVKQADKLDPFFREQIFKWLRTNIADCLDPRARGKSLKGNHKGLWRYRVGSYRVIVEIFDNELVVLALEVGHRKEIY